MSTIVHEREGVIFKNRDGSYSGAIMVNGKTYDLSGVGGKSRAGAVEYIQLTARERSVPAAAGDRSTSPATLSGRSARRLAQCEKADISKYGAGIKR